MQTKLDAAKMTMIGLDTLYDSPFVKTTKKEASNEETLEKAKDDSRIGKALTCVVLYTIIVELLIKHLWEKKHKNQAPHNHNIEELFSELDGEIQKKVRRIYDGCAKQYNKAIQAGQRQKGKSLRKLKTATLNEALQWNKKAIKEMKYEMELSGKIVPNGMLWKDQQTMWIANKLPNFALELGKWAINEEVAYSGAIRSPIPAQSDHSFRWKPITDSGANRSVIPVGNRSLLGCAPEWCMGSNPRS